MSNIIILLFYPIPPRLSITAVDCGLAVPPGTAGDPGRCRIEAFFMAFLSEEAPPGKDFEMKTFG
jgi:hypothetical protein